MARMTASVRDCNRLPLEDTTGQRIKRTQVTPRRAYRPRITKPDQQTQGLRGDLPLTIGFAAILRERLEKTSSIARGGTAFDARAVCQAVGPSLPLRIAIAALDRLARDNGTSFARSADLLQTVRNVRHAHAFATQTYLFPATTEHSDGNAIYHSGHGSWPPLWSGKGSPGRP